MAYSEPAVNGQYWYSIWPGGRVDARRRAGL